MAALLLAAVGGTRGETSLYHSVSANTATRGHPDIYRGSCATYVALAADGLLAVVLGGESLQGGLNDTTTEAEDKVKGGLL